MLIEHIDAIARKKRRGVLFLDFSQEGSAPLFDSFNLNWENLPIRQQVIAWLEQNQIGWSHCGYFADVNLMGGYQGRIYLDVSLNIQDPTYKKLSRYLETPEGKMKLAGVKFQYLPLEMAMKNAHHDEPGFWEHWAENF